ncbi:hypothetical protein Phi10:1_gp001 [Cellulophaga phage phi10:1]|uniref:Uncharacterized protein n=1 Tax=Cellulophaga phage phi10:1 TaxID=1327981 RepID=S0A1H5_9CAUD|nr:hypothetical protein Phi10:1_gp001 [Cellulophaga phage phi10:1]AGO48342.1 hypothetical protein Phi10:1_gp001 [Cellulophaga phage phi10:1]
MNATELRIGNYVNSLYESSTKVKSIVESTEWGGHYIETENNKTSIMAVEPIPLTEDWLECFGVLKPEYPYSFEVAIIGGDYRAIWNGIMKEVKYVHELQNLYFALIGKELTTK